MWIEKERSRQKLLFKTSVYIGYDNGKAILYLEKQKLDTNNNTFTKPTVALNFKRRFKTYDFHRIPIDVSFLHG